MKKTKQSAKKAGRVAQAVLPFELITSVESELSDNGGCITWQGYRSKTCNKEPAHWPDFYVLTLMRNNVGKKASVYDLVAIGGQSLWRKIKYTVLSHGVSVTFIVKGVKTVVAPGESFEMPVYEAGDEKWLPEVCFGGDVLFLRAEPVLSDASPRKGGGRGDPNQPKLPPPPYPGGGQNGSAD